MKYTIMTSLAFAAFLGLILGLTAAPAPQAAEAAAAPAAADRDQIDRWVAQLGDDDFNVREAASRELLGREEAVPALRQALKSPDAEKRKRTAEILKARERKRAAHELDRALELAKDGRIDEVVERLVRWQGSDDDKKGWEAVCRIAAKVMELADHDQGAGGPIIPKAFLLPPNYFRDLWAGPRAKEAAFPKPGVREMDRESALLRAETIDTRMTGTKCIIAVSRSLRLSSGAVKGCILVCGGNVEAADLIGSIVICDGDFKGGASNCIIIARGKVTAAGVFGNVFISAREVESLNSRGVKPLHDGRYGCVVRTGNAVPLGFIKFFDPAEEGVEASADADGGTVPDGVLVKSVAKGKPFAAAGLRAGDVITAVGDEKVVPSEKAADQFDSFRRARARRWRRMKHSQCPCGGRTRFSN